ncbi:ABC transporter [Mobiluncus mulieris]|uniref:ABC transporter n=1 Tax=Mobiluncus mulieris TaxID=2052 RepID=UPI00242C7708|nr:ABC transporter [Mobiluncus mulieris]
MKRITTIGAFAAIAALALTGVARDCYGRGFRFINTWNEYAAAFVLVQKAELQSLTVAMPQFLGLYVREWQFMFTTSVIAIVPVIIMFALIEKRLIGGLTAGSIK